MKQHFLWIGLVAFLAFGLTDASVCNGAQKKKKADKTYVCAYVWPSCHDDSLAHRWLWEEGIGEWEVIKKGDPRFPGHYQPRQPLWGYEPDNDPAVVEKWIRTALKYGVNRRRIPRPLPGKRPERRIPQGSQPRKDEFLHHVGQPRCEI